MKKNDLNPIKGEDKTGEWWDTKEVNKPIDLLISIPSSDGNVSIHLDNSLREAFGNTILGDKLKISTNFVTSDSLVCRARDKMAAYFLETGAEWQLQIDSDIVFPSGMGPNLAQFYSNWMSEETLNQFLGHGVFRSALSMNAIDEILRSGIQDGHKIVGGLYFWRGGKKNLNDTASVIPRKPSGEFEIEFKQSPDNYLYTDKLATGFLLVHRDVYTDIRDANPELSYTQPSYIPGKPMTAFYTPIITQELDNKGNDYSYYRSEDFAFSWRAAQCGYKPVINMNILLGHIGTQIYSWLDRPIIQKMVMQSFDNPNHFIEKDEK